MTDLALTALDDAHPLGYAWRGPGLNSDLQRFFVHADCLKSRDKPDVAVVQVPFATRLRPKCWRCSVPLGWGERDVA